MLLATTVVRSIFFCCGSNCSFASPQFKLLANVNKQSILVATIQTGSTARFFVRAGILNCIICVIEAFGFHLSIKQGFVLGRKNTERTELHLWMAYVTMRFDRYC